MPETTPGSQTARGPRKVPRRATSPAGSPAQGSQSAVALLIIGTDGVIVKAPAPHPLTPSADREPGEGPSLPATAGDDDSVVAAKHTDAATVTAEVNKTAAVQTEAVQTEAVQSEAVAVEADEVVVTGVLHAAATPHIGGAVVSVPQDLSAPFNSTRRERRLAELHTGSSSEQAPVGTTSAGSSGLDVAATAAANKSVAAPYRAADPHDQEGDRTAPAVAARPNRSRPVAFLRGLFFLAIISALVVGMGTVLSGQENGTVGPSQTELHRQEAWEATTQLQAQAAALSSTAAASVQQQLQRIANDLAVQALALSDGLPPNTAKQTATTTVSTASATPTVTGLLQGLSTNSEALLEHALTAEHAMGGVFAAAGTSQLIQAQELALSVGALPAASQFLPALVAFPAPVGPECSSTLEPRPGATIDAALRAAALGEQKAVYAYQVSTTRMSEPQFSESAELLERHQDKLAVLDKELEVRCLPPAAPVAGFDLDPAFTADPPTALAALEGELAGIYADLAALSPARSEEAAATAGTAPPSVSASLTDPPKAARTKSATGEGAANAPVAASGTLRELSVLWLLDSSQTQEFWGGTVGALAGMAD